MGERNTALTKKKLMKSLICLAFAAATSPGYAQVANICLEDYFHLPAAKQDSKIRAIANDDASFYDAKTAAKIRAVFNVIEPGANYSLGSNQVDELSRRAAKTQNTHSASLNTLIGKYIVAKFGPPPPARK